MQERGRSGTSTLGFRSRSCVCSPREQRKILLRRVMSAFGTKQTYRGKFAMSALGGKAKRTLLLAPAAHCRQAWMDVRSATRLDPDQDVSGQFAPQAHTYVARTRTNVRMSARRLNRAPRDRPGSAFPSRSAGIV